MTGATARNELFTTVRTVGGLLPADTLARLSEGKGLPGLAPADYWLAEPDTVRAMANRAWARLTGRWPGFKAKLAADTTNDATGVTREWVSVLFEELGYGALRGLARPQGFEVGGGSVLKVSHCWNATPIHVVGAKVPLDRRTPDGRGKSRPAAFSLVQELLNRSDDHLWGIATNGLRLQLLRDSSSLVRQAYVDFDLAGMLDGEVFSDFILLYLLCHASRVAVRDDGAGPASCWLERWRAEAIETGTRALDQLRVGVTEALRVLGRGFLRHPDNGELRAAMASRALDPQDYYRALLRTVYRLLFCFVAEDRGVLLDPEADPAAVERYKRYFSTERLRGIAERRQGTRHGDIWEGLRVVFDGLGSDTGRPELALPALGGMLFDPASLGPLAGAKLANADLLAAVRHLCQVTDPKTGVRSRVNYRELDSEELGSVYESLLEYAPRYSPEGPSFDLQALAGNERKTTGSYYTPTSLINCLLDTALDPLLDEADRSPEPERALLELTVCDPACGSGHFLVAAARRIARRLAIHRSGEREPAEAPLREALRDVIGHCVYGVDLNELAAELAKISLWLEAVEPGKPLPFLDARVKVGNSLLGTTPRLLAEGIPDDAFKPLTGDDKKVAQELRRRNKKERQDRDQYELFDPDRISVANTRLAKAAERVAQQADDTIAALRERERTWRELEASPELAKARLLADAWCAAFVWPKRDGAPEAVTQRVLTRIDQDPDALPAETAEEIRRLKEQYRFFHWHLEFPEVFRVPERPEDADNPELGWSGGFSCVLGNPPWERVKLQEQEFFAARNEDIAKAPNAAARRKLIQALKGVDDALLAAFEQAKRKAEGESHFLRLSDRYPLCGRGDINTYAVFAEADKALVRSRGSAGLVLPTGIATDATTQEFFRSLMAERALTSLFDFYNNDRLFYGVGNRRFKFCLLTLGGYDRRTDMPEFAFFLRSPSQVSEPSRRFAMSQREVALVNPNTGTCPVFRSRRDAEITLAIYSRVPVLCRDDDSKANPWGISFIRMFDMANDSKLFRTREEFAEDWRLDGNIFVSERGRYVPLYEAKMLHYFDHRYGDYRLKPEGSQDSELPRVDASWLKNPDYSVMPRYWVKESEVGQRLNGRWSRRWLIGWRDITNSANERTVIASVLPPYAVNHKFPIMLPGKVLNGLGSALLANFSSFALDYVARQKMGGTSLTYFILKQLPILRPEEYSARVPWGESGVLADWLNSRVLELVYTSWELRDFASDCGYYGPPFVWDESRRQLLRAEVDAAYFHLYGISRDDVAYIMETFPIVRRKEESSYGEYRTKRLILEVYDQMADAIAGGSPFDTVLDPPPGQGPRHPEKAR